MIEPRQTIDIDKLVEVTFEQKLGIISHFNDEFVFVKFKNKKNAKDYKKKHLSWPPKNKKHINLF